MPSSRSSGSSGSILVIVSTALPMHSEPTYRKRDMDGVASARNEDKDIAHASLLL